MAGRGRLACQRTRLSRLRYNWRTATAHLCATCPRLARFINDFGNERLWVRGDQDVFRALARAIAYQQLSGAAAGTIHGRFEALFTDQRPDARQTLALGSEALRQTGLSRAKTLALLDLAQRVHDRDLPGARQLSRLDDDTLIQRLSAVRGVGPWTVQMYLLFTLGRPDIMPATDLGVQKGVQQIYALAQKPTPAQVLERTGKLAPYRSAAAWYFWRAADNA